MKEKTIGIVVGIRFSRSFRVPDIAGEIIDDILYGKDTPFGSKFFPEVQETPREKILVNNETTEYLRINRDDLIFGLEVKSNFDERLEWISSVVMPYLKDLFHKYGIKNFSRFGIIFTHKIDRGTILSNAVKSLTERKMGEVDNINISFSKKLPTMEALYRKEVDDYKNTIYNFTEIGDSLITELDFQYYYMPLIEDFRECFVEKILTDAKTFLETNYYPWLTIDTHDSKDQ